MATVTYAHIKHNSEGEPIVEGTRIMVRTIALDLIAHGWDAEEIQQHHPDLTLGQIHSALAYYFDHKEEMDRDIRQRHERVRALRAAQEESPGRQAAGTGTAPVSVRFYLDHHVDAAITEGLRQRGIDVLTCREDGTETWDDEHLLERATALGRVLFSQDDDLLAIAHRHQRGAPFCRADLRSSARPVDRPGGPRLGTDRAGVRSR